MSNPKKTATQNAMKPDPVAKKAADEAAKTNEKTATTPATGEKSDQSPAPESDAAAVGTGGDVSGAKQETEAENPPGPDERKADSGTSAGVDKARDGIIEDEEETMTDEERALKAEGSTDEEIDLDNPQHVEKLFTDVIDGVVSLGHPLMGALASKPKVAENWNSIVKKAKKLQAKYNADKEARLA